MKAFVPESKPAQTRKGGAKSSNSETEIEKERDQKSSDIKEVESSSSASLSEETQSTVQMPGKTNPASQPADPLLAKSPPPKGGPLDNALHAGVVPIENPDGLHIPHLHPPQYVHNFDTWTLVKEVEKGGFTNGQAITAMKAVRVLLAKNLDIAKEGLVSKSDVENVSPDGRALSRANFHVYWHSLTEYAIGDLSIPCSMFRTPD
jgi:hypothetical protein